MSVTPPAMHTPSIDARITVVIADDEPPARRGIRALLAAHADVEIVAEARNGADAIQAIETLRPAAVFLDVQMPEGTGFDVVRAIGVERMPVVVFATAFDSYALQAFEAHALDYLLKPYDRARFDATLERVRQQLRRRTLDDRLLSFLDRVEQHAQYQPRIAVRHGARTQFVPVTSIDCIEAEANYVRLRVGEHSYLVRETLSSIVTRLDPTRFLRVHRSQIVQTARVTHVESLFSGEFVLTLASGRTVTTGRTYRAAVQDAFGL